MASGRECAARGPADQIGSQAARQGDRGGTGQGEVGFHRQRAPHGSGGKVSENAVGPAHHPHTAGGHIGPVQAADIEEIALAAHGRGGVRGAGAQGIGEAYQLLAGGQFLRRRDRAAGSAGDHQGQVKRVGVVDDGLGQAIGDRRRNLRPHIPQDHVETTVGDDIEVIRLAPDGGSSRSGGPQPELSSVGSRGVVVTLGGAQDTLVVDQSRHPVGPGGGPGQGKRQQHRSGHSFCDLHILKKTKPQMNPDKHR